MKKKIILALLCLFCLSFKIHSEVLEINHLEDVLPFVNEKTLVVLDIDDTLMIPSQMLGGDCWFRRQVKKLLAEGYSPADAIALILPEYFRLQHKLNVLPVEGNTAAVVHELQEKSFRVIGLTTRTEPVIYRTIEQLKSIGIDLKKTSLMNVDLSLRSHIPLHYIEGILSTETRHKGDSLMKLCEDLDYVPERVVFVNDKLKYVLQLEESCESNDIPYYGFRYGGADIHDALYDSNVAAIQHKYVDEILSNEDAAKILNATKDIYYD